jgi:hypothetical protein
MINKLQVGKLYQIIGIGLWSDVKQDLKVVGVTTASEIEILALGVYETWFQGYSIPEAYYQNLLSENSVIYHCRTIVSRTVLPSEGGDDMYIFPAMINYPNSSELVECTSYIWELRTKPYQKNDIYNPNTILPQGLNLQTVINETVRKYIYDTFVVYRNEESIILSETEYAIINKYREYEKLRYEYNHQKIDDELQKERSYMYGVVETVNKREEELRIAQENVAKYMQAATAQYHTNADAVKLLGAQENKLRNIHYKMEIILANINAYLTPEEQIQLPPFSEL